MERSLYIHIPFCRRRCTYCNFYSTLYEESEASSYMDVLSGQLDDLDGAFSTVFVGGGTPTVFSKRLLEALLKRLKGLSGGRSEFTAEANPESLDEEKMRILLDHGVNRLSIGVQSLDDRKLKKLGRIHNARKARDAVEKAHKKGFKNISADLIFGVWDETIDSWERELEKIVKMPVAHISCYELTYEKGTVLFAAVKNKSIVPIDDSISAAMYELAIDRFGLAGIKQYEVSNFARSGCECRHNLNYWENGPYTGLGPSAASYIDGVRTKNVSDLKEYLGRIESGKSPIESSERLSPIRRARETAAIKIRTREGIGFDWFRTKTGFDFLELERRAVRELIAKDLIKYKKENNLPVGIALKRKGFLFCDTVSSALL